MSHAGFVIPADPTQPCKTVEWTNDTDLLAGLRVVIGCEWVETVRLEIDGTGTVVCWVDEEGRFPDDRVENRRFGLFAAGLGQPFMVFGTVVLTGDADEDGETQGLPAELLADLPDAIAGVTA